MKEEISYKGKKMGSFRRDMETEKNKRGISEVKNMISNV